MRVPAREEGAVADLGADGLAQALALGLRQVLGDRAAERAVLEERHVGQAARAALLGELLPGVEDLARLGRPARHDDGADVRRLEDAERRLGEVRREVDELDAEADVGAVDAEPAHRLVVGHARERRRDLEAEDVAPDAGHDGLGQLVEVLLVGEAHLDVELGELRLAVGAEVLVAVAAGDLVVALHAGDHEQLLEQLRRLRQGVPVTGLQAHRHEEVAGALGRRAGERRGLDVEEVALVHDPADRPGDERAGPERLGGAGPAQVEVAVLQAHLVADRGVVVERERQRRGGRQHLDLARGDLDGAGRQRVVAVALGPHPHLADDAHAVLGAQVVGDVRLAHDDLRDAGAVAQVEEGDAAVVAPPGHPAGERDGGAGVLLPERPGLVRADHSRSSSSRRRARRAVRRPARARAGP